MTILAAFCFALWSCGGGGSDGPGVVLQGDTALTETNAPTAAAGLLKAADIIGPLEGISGALAVSSATTAAATLQKPISNILSITISAAKHQKNSTDKNAPTAFLPLPYTVSCPDGGSLTLQNATWDGPSEPTSPDEVENFSGSVSFNECKKGTLSLDGSAKISIEGFASAPESVELTASMTYNDSATDTTLQLSNLNAQVSNMGPGIALKNATIELSGSVEGVLGEESINISFDHFVVSFTSFTEPAAYESAKTTAPTVTGKTVALSGRIKTSCLNTWLTVTTAVPIKFIQGELCPSAGDLSLASQSNIIRVVIAENFEISLYFNAEWVETYEDCTKLKVLCPSE